MRSFKELTGIFPSVIFFPASELPGKLKKCKNKIIAVICWPTWLAVTGFCFVTARAHAGGPLIELTENCKLT